MAQKWYERMDLLGSGTFWEVFRVINKIDGQNYALKVIKCYSNAEIKRALDESKLMSQLVHANVVKLFQTSLKPAP